ncbi:retrotransposon protein, putative, ty1-copia subclass [Tanacetum coccineum]|uniref:Retrotransposon protein, putative, ty1-copia subclass n=1 Tax=Tanacetum coccineum TaxID=301880 RepID=A0ABQ5BRH1_9ASTR
MLQMNPHPFMEVWRGRHILRLIHELGDHGEPPNYRAALLDPESEKCLEAMNVEMQSMKDNQVWNLVDLPPNSKGFTHTYGVDYEETFSLVANIKAIRILIAISAYYDYEIWQMDVKTAFLNGLLNEDVYKVQPEGFVNPKHPRLVCKLQRSIYGLKQASRSWNKRFDEEIQRYGFTQNPDEPYVYKKASRSTIVFLILYVDDILIMGNNIPMLQDVKSWLGKCFAMKDLGEEAYILGIKLYRDRSRRLIDLSQNAYIDKILKRFKMDIIPMQPNVDLSFIMYVVRCTRPDVAFSESLTSRHQQNPGAADWKISKKITTTMSSTEAEYIAASEAAMEAISLRKFIYRLGVVPSIDRPMDMYYDNTCDITIADEPGVQKDNNLADPFTKPMPCAKHVEHARSIRLRPAGSFM